MEQKKGKNTLLLQTPVYVIGRGNAVSPFEEDGLLHGRFDRVTDDEYFGEKTFEKAETKLQKTALKLALHRAGIATEQLDVTLGGDLLNQCTASGYSLRDNGVAFIGMYGACSTMALTMATGAMTICAGYAKTAAAMTSSHFCGAERQFRYPLEYGGQRPPSAQRTVTGAGAVILSSEKKSKVRLAGLTIGSIIDYGITDINNMGGAMAPAAADTMANFFTDTQLQPEDFDLIVTGDLAAVGRDILRDLMQQRGFALGDNYNDCGMMIYDNKRQDTHAGGSGCGCSAVVLTADILPRMESGQLNKVLLVGTGALMSPLTVMQGESIPSVAHLVYLTTGEA